MYSTPSPRLTFGHSVHFYLAVIDCLDGKMDQIIQVRAVSVMEILFKKKKNAFKPFVLVESFSLLRASLLLHH